MGVELAKAFVRVRADSSGLGQDLGGVREEVTSTLKEISAAATAVLGAFSAAAGSFLRSGLFEAGRFEQTTIAFETMLGSAEETSKLLADLTEFAAKTPFEMPGILQAARGLVQFGERGDDLMETLKILGNASAGTSTDFGLLALIFNQIRGVGKLLTQDFRQLSTRGVLSLQDIADHFDVTTAEAQKMLSAGKVGFEDVREILKGLTEEGGRFFNLMERQSRSLLGLISTLKDAWGIMSRVLATSVLPVAKKVVTVFITFVEQIQSFVEESDGMVGAALGGATAFSSLGTAIAGATLAARVFGITAKKALIGTGIGIALVALGAAVGLFVNWLSKAKPIQDAVSEASGKLMRAWELLKETAVIAFNAIGQALNQVFGIDFGEAADSVQGIIVKIIGWVSNLALETSEWIRAIAENWKALWKEFPEIAMAAFSFLFDIIGNSLEAIGINILNGIKSVYSDFINFILDQFGSLIPAAQKVALQAVAAGLEVKQKAPTLGEIFTPSEDTKRLIEQIEALEAIGKTKARLQAERPARPGLEEESGDKEAAKELAKEQGREMAKGFLEAGRFGFAEIGTKIQDALLKADKSDLDNKRNSLLEQGVKKQEELIKAVKDSGAKPGTLTP